MLMPMSEREISFDTETTGFKPEDGHRLVEIGAVEMVNRIPTGRSYHQYINPQRDVPEGAFRVHGLSEEFLSDYPLFKEIVDDFLEFVGDSTLIIHNADFDMRFINAELKWVNKPLIPVQQAFCTLKHARATFPGAPASLDALCKRFQIDNSERTKHGALLDAELLAEMYLELMGGAQVGMALDAEPEGDENGGDGAKRVNQFQVLAARPHAASEAEEAAHKAFVEQHIKKPLWEQV